MWDIVDFLGMELTIILHSCEFVRVDPTIVPTVIGLFDGLLFSLGIIGRGYMDAALLSSTPDSLYVFSIICGGDC